MAKRAPSTKRASSTKGTAADPFGLRPDGGWGDAVRGELADAGADERRFLEALLGHLAAARPRGLFKDFGEPQREVDAACFMELLDAGDEDDPDDALVDEPGWVTHTPGMPEYAAALWMCAPREEWFPGLDALARRFGRDRVEPAVSRWVAAASRSKPGLLNRPGPNRWLLHAAVFACARLGTARCVDALRQLAQAACDNRTAQGPTCAAALVLIGTPDALGALHLLAERSRLPAHRARFGRAARHLQAVTGITADEAAERYAPTFDLTPKGTRTFTIGGCMAELAPGPAGRVEVRWRSLEGKPVKSVPAAARKAGAAAVADLKTTAKSVEKMLAAHRDRLDRMLIDTDEKTWRLADWRGCYVDHPLVGLLARRLVWLLDGAPVLFPAAGEAPRGVKGRMRDAGPDAEVRIWHPAARPAEEVLAWRQRLAELNVTQPFKQAHREVYLLTDAERRTRTYSNRFAAHVMRQHQFRQLAMRRGWDAPLKLVHDGAADSVASRALPRRGLRAELWTEPVEAGDDALTPAGAYLYLTTDQVRFYRAGEREPLPLEQVPPLVFSEIMRDVDLFVGVASVGNDPTWHDGGPGGRYRDYWHGVSFGELGETARTRREALERLVPRLRIASRVSLADRFLVVRGDLRTYKIHLGSGNILMEPNDHYLCIVPDRSLKAEGTGDVFLPFEGDATLSVILSKAFLLAEDQSIKDPTITRQIRI